MRRLLFAMSWPLALLTGCGASAPPVAHEPPPPPPAASPAEAKTTPPASDDDPFPTSADAAWFVVRWDANADATESALRTAGLAPARETSDKGGFQTVRVTRGDWTATVYFDVNGRASTQIVVVSSRASREIGDAAEARLRKRFGAPSETSRVVERVWRGEDKPTITVKAITREGKVSLVEEWIREGASGPTGFEGLEWGAAPAKVKAALKGAGFEVADAKAAIRFSKAGREGEAAFAEDGLTQIVVHPTTLPGESAATARVDELTKSLGRPRATTTETTTAWKGAQGVARVAVEEKIPGGAWAVRETYTATRTPR